jgi:hypothetical protein
MHPDQIFLQNGEYQVFTCFVINGPAEFPKKHMTGQFRLDLDGRKAPRPLILNGKNNE